MLNSIKLNKAIKHIALYKDNKDLVFVCFEDDKIKIISQETKGIIGEIQGGNDI